MKKPEVWVNDDNYLCVDYGNGRDYAFNIEDLEPEDREHLADAFNKMPQGGRFQLDDHITPEEGETPGSAEITITPESTGISIEAKGYGVAGMEEGGGIVFVEFWNKELRILAWSDINQEDPTHTINLEGARLENRKEEE